MKTPSGFTILYGSSCKAQAPFLIIFLSLWRFRLFVYVTLPRVNMLVGGGVGVRCRTLAQYLLYLDLERPALQFILRLDFVIYLLVPK